MKPFTPSWKFRSSYCHDCGKITRQYLTPYDMLVCNECTPRSGVKTPSYKQKLFN